MTASSPHLRLNNGVDMPALGLGVYRSAPAETAQAVDAAIRSGYRLIDTAAVYLNEREVGAGIARSGVPRDELFITTKVWISDYGPTETPRAFDLSLRKLGLERLDLYLLHWPAPVHFDTTVAAWQAAEALLASGRVGAIGVCNFTEKHLDDLAAHSRTVPAVNQIELHPMFAQRGLLEANQRRGIVTQAWSPIGGVNVYGSKAPDPAKNPLTHPVVVAIAERHGKSAAQVVLRWHLQRGVSVIPKSVRPERIAENADVFDFALDADELAAIDGLDTGSRGGPDPEVISTRVVKFTIPD